MMDSKNGKKVKRKLLNLFDIIVLAVAAAAVIGVVIWQSSTGSGPIAAPQTKTIRYTVELTGMINGSESLIEVGDQVTDNIKKYALGKVVAVDIEPTVVSRQNYETGDTVSSEVPGQMTATILLEAECTETEGSFVVGGGYVVRCGLTASVYGPGWFGSGYIVFVERGEGE